MNLPIPENLVPILTLLPAMALLAACAAEHDTGGGTASSPPAKTHDIHSFGRPDEVRTTHADIDWTVDFEKKEIRGKVTWTVERADDAGDAPLVLDTTGLTIDKVTTVGGEPLRFELAEPHPALGTALLIYMEAGKEPGADQVTIAYHTGPESAGIQWLAPGQTAGGKKPYLFSQAQSILARTFLPCQDSPGVRFTFNAAVRTPPPLRPVGDRQIL